MSKYPSVYGVTATVAIFDLECQMVLLGKRKETAEVYPGAWCLIGGFLGPKRGGHAGETIRMTAKREVKEETGINILEAELNLVEVYSDPNTDPRGHVINIAFYVNVDHDGVVPVAGDDIEQVEWVDILEAISSSFELAFNHADILEAAIELWYTKNSG